ncbi:MAG: GTP cyclohydrolase II, partial [Geminicoccales bacterium]
KYDALARQGIEIVERVPIPADRIPEDARVEIDAKKAAGYYAEAVPSEEELAAVKGRALTDYEAR